MKLAPADRLLECAATRRHLAPNRPAGRSARARCRPLVPSDHRGCDPRRSPLALVLLPRLRRLRADPEASVESLIPELSCQRCSPHPPFTRLIGLASHPGVTPGPARFAKTAVGSAKILTSQWGTT